MTSTDSNPELPGFEDDFDEPPVAKKSRWRRALIVLLVSGLFLAGLAAGGVWYLTERYAGNVARIPNVFAGLNPEQRPAPAVVQPGTDGPPETFLLTGSDSRSDEPTTGNGATASGGSQRSDVIMLLQIAGDRKTGFTISIPRDSYVAVPGHGTTKINAAYAYGGPTLLIQTVEQLTGIRIDHFAAIDFYGFKAMTDALGGVDVRIAQPTSAFGVKFTAGVNHLDGEQALAYVRERKDLPGGDFDRVQRQQNYLRAMLGTVSRDNLLTDPGKLDDFLLAFTNSISVDDELSDRDLLGLAVGLRNLGPQDVTFMTVPVAGVGTEGEASVVYIDQTNATTMWDYIKAGTLQDHYAEFKVLPTAPR